MNSTVLTHEGDAHSTPAGRYSVNVINNGTACGQHLYRVTVTHPGFTPQPAFDRDHDRPFGHTDQAQAQQLAEHYAAGLVELFTVEAEGISDERIAEVAQGVNTNMDAREATVQAQVEQTTAAVEQVTANPAESWAAFRQQARQIRPTLAGAHTAPETPAQINAACKHRNGTVYPGDGVTRPTLKAMARKGLGQLRFDGNRKRITALDLNRRGLALADNGQVAA